MGKFQSSAGFYFLEPSLCFFVDAIKEQNQKYDNYFIFTSDFHCRGYKSGSNNILGGYPWGDRIYKWISEHILKVVIISSASVSKAQHV